jgi:hypothetical protein
MTWHSIDSAPDDGSAILLWPYTYSNSFWSGTTDPEVVLGYYDANGEEWYNPEQREYFEPTHWMPLPEPP